MKDIRIGKVSSIHYQTGTVDVLFEDEENTVRTDVPLFSNEYKMPEVGDLVAVIFQSNSDASEQGFVIGKPYSASNRPEKYGRGTYYKKLSEKSYIHYDPETDTLKIHAGTVEIPNLKKG